MPRKRLPRSEPVKVVPRRKPPAEDTDEWGYRAEATLPPLPPEPTARNGEQPSPPPAVLVALGAPPESARAGQAWAYRVLQMQAHEAMLDTSISQATRRKEVRVILAAAAHHYPDAARAELAGLIDDDRRQLEDRRRAKAKAKLEALPPAGGAKVIPIRGDG